MINLSVRTPMSISSYLNILKERVYICIEKNINFNINIRDVPISYLGAVDFYKSIENNYPEASETRINLHWKYDQGIYKWNEEKVIIKTDDRFNPGLLLVELLHSQTIFKGKKYVEDWIKEGIPHYLAKEISSICGLEYQVSLSEKDFLLFWKKIHRMLEKKDFDIFTTILYTTRIEISIKTLKEIFNYPKDDILELDFEEVKKHLSILGF